MTEVRAIFFIIGLLASLKIFCLVVKSEGVGGIKELFLVLFFSLLIGGFVGKGIAMSYKVGVKFLQGF